MMDPGAMTDIIGLVLVVGIIIFQRVTFKKAAA